MKDPVRLIFNIYFLNSSIKVAKILILYLMEWSKYNFLFKSEKLNCYLLYNSLSDAFIKLDEENYQDVIKYQQNPEHDEDEELKKQLVENGILVKDNRLEFLKLKLIKSAKRFNRELMILTIAPTSDCNFKCGYCYENNPVPLYMDDKTEEQIIHFIKSHSNVKFLSITWYGGEPLLAFDRIKSITEKIKLLNLTFSARIVTNGYSLTPEMIQNFPDLHINLVHITLDGPEEIHNKRRPHKVKSDSFQVIINNIETITRLLPSMKIIIRVNVDKENKEEYHKIYEFIQSKFSQNIAGIYPGFVKKHTEGVVPVKKVC